MVSYPSLIPCWVESTRGTRCTSLLTLTHKATLTDINADITDVFPKVEIATPGINCPDKKHLSSQERYPLALCRIVETFMLGTIREFYHIFLV